MSVLFHRAWGVRRQGGYGGRRFLDIGCFQVQDFDVRAVCGHGCDLSPKTDVGQCPYCLENFTATPGIVESGLSRCEKCGEYSEIANKIVKPMDPASYSESPKFESALFKQGSMPNACAACGAPAARLDTVTSSSMNKTLAVAGAARLMTGTPGLAIFSSKQASISIPYCDQHRNAVTIGFDWRKKPILTWSSLGMMRRYLAVNRGKEKY